MCITVKQMMQIEENGHQMGFLRKFMMENAGAATVKRIVEKYSSVWSIDPNYKKFWSLLGLEITVVTV